MLVSEKGERTITFNSALFIIVFITSLISKRHLRLTLGTNLTLQKLSKGEKESKGEQLKWNTELMKEFFDYVLGCEENVNRKSKGVYMGKRRIKIMIPKEKKKRSSYQEHRRC